jgi:hypothetical protein
MSFFTTLFDRKQAAYVYHSGIWALIFLAAWGIQFHRTTYKYDYVTQSLHVSTPNTQQHSYWTLDTITHAQVPADGATAQSVSHIDLKTCLEAEDCFKDGASKSDIPQTCTTKALASGVTDRPRFSCAIPEDLMQEHSVCNSDNMQGYPLMKRLCKLQFANPPTTLQVNEHTTFSISAAHSPRVLMFVVLTIMTSCNFYMFLTSLYRRKVRWFVNTVGTFSAAVTGKDNEPLSQSAQLSMFKRYFVTPLFLILILVWWFVFYNTTQHEVFWPKPFGTIFYSAVSLVLVLYLAAGVDNSIEEESADTATSTDTKVKFTADITVSDTATTLADPLHATEKQLNVSSFTGNNKFKINAFLQPGKNQNADTVTQVWSSNLNFSDADYQSVEPEFSYFNLMQTWVLPFLFLAVYLLKHNYMLDSDITVIFVGMLIFGLLEIASKRMYETGRIFAKISDKGNNNVGDAMIAPLSVIRLLLLCFQAALVWLVYTVTEWNLHAHSDGYWHVGNAANNSRWDDIQFTFSILFIVYFGLVALGKLYTLMPMYAFNSEAYKQSMQVFTEHYDGYAVFLLNCFVAFVFLYEVGAVGGILFENDNLAFDNPAFLQVLAKQAVTT